MKLGGKKIAPNEEILVLPRPDGHLVFKARAVMDMMEFEALCPVPKAKMIRSRTEGLIPDPFDTSHLSMVDVYEQKRMAFMVIKSLEATPDLEWETVDINDPETWLNYREEFKQSGLGETEVSRLIMLVMSANSLDESKIKQARESFLAGQVVGDSLPSHQAALANGQSGEHVNA